MVEQILTNVYRMEIPIPENPPGSTNSYVVKGPRRNLIIDTGLGGQDSTVSHLAYLAQAGEVHMEAGEGHAVYSLMDVHGNGSD